MADKVLYLVADPLTGTWIESRNSTAESLMDSYSVGEPLMDCYAVMAERILEAVRQGHQTCAIFYGHPAVFVHPSHEVIRLARDEGFEAQMQPGISAEDCLFADLGVDPANNGCQSFESADFLLYRRRFDPSCALILWQVGVIGTNTVQRMRNTPPGPLRVLVDRLLEDYPAEHEVLIYEASQFTVCEPMIQRVPLKELPAADVSGIATLFVPPLSRPPEDAETRALLEQDGYVLD